MKRLHSWYGAAFQFPAETRGAVTRLLKGGAEDFLKAIAEPATEYAEMVKAEVPRRELARCRESLRKIGHAATVATELIGALDADCARLLEQFFILETHARGADRVALSTLKRLAAVSERAAACKQLNPGRGAPVDRDLRRLAIICAQAYRQATNRTPSASPRGTFAKTLLIVLKAVRAVPASRTSISKELLENVVR